CTTQCRTTYRDVRHIALSIRRLDWWIMFLLLNVTPTTEIYTLSLHDALPISVSATMIASELDPCAILGSAVRRASSPSCRSISRDRKSTRLNSSHLGISYAVFCLKKKKIASVGVDSDLQEIAAVVVVVPELALQAGIEDRESLRSCRAAEAGRQRRAPVNVAHDVY